MIDVLQLGTGAMVPLPDRWLSSTLVRTGGSLILLDCGEGTQIAMRIHGWGFRRLDAICLSHLHADHVAGIPGLLHTVANAGKSSPMTIYGPAGTIEVVQGLHTIVRALPFQLVVHELEPGDVVDGPGELTIRVAEGLHRIAVLGYRFERSRAPRFDPEKARSLEIPVAAWSTLQRGDSIQLEGRTIEPKMVMGEERAGLSLGFVTDTRPTEALQTLVRGVDLLIAEGTYGDDADLDKARQHRHMTFRESATLARDAGVGALWLTHFSAGMPDPGVWESNAREVFADVTVGYSGLTGRLAFDEGYRDISADKPVPVRGHAGDEEGA